MTVTSEAVPVTTTTTASTTPTEVAPLTDAAGCTYAIQVWVGSQNTQPTNAASWIRNADGSLDLYDAVGCLVAGYPSGGWASVQVVRLSQPAPAS